MRRHAPAPSFDAEEFEMDVSQVIEKLETGLSARRVFSEPIERDGSIVVLAAKVRGGGGGGGGRGRSEPGEAARTGEGLGSGFGLVAHPSGAFIIREGRVRWRPAVDVNRILLGFQVLAAIRLLVAARRRERGAGPAVRRLFRERVAKRVRRRVVRRGLGKLLGR